MRSEVLTVTWEQVAAFRLARHHLLESAPKKKIVAVVGDMAGAQAQLMSATQMALGARVNGLKIADVEEGMNVRKIVRASCMRCTLFLTPAAELGIFALGATARGEKEALWTFKKGVPQRVIDKAIRATLAVLDEPLTRVEISERVSEALGVKKSAAHGGGWGNQKKLAAVSVGHLIFPIVDLLHLVAAGGVICYGADRGHEPTFVRADAWIPQWRNMPKAEAESLLLRKYLRAYAPATVADFAFWSGFSLTEARAIWMREEADLIDVNVAGWEASILREDVNQLTKAKFKSPSIRLLPHFDSFILGHKEREHLIAKKYQAEAYRAQGWIALTVLVNGKIAAVWEHTRTKHQLHIKVKKFIGLSREVVAGIHAEARNFSKFWGIENVDVEIR